MIADVRLLASETGTSVSAVCRTLSTPRSTLYARDARIPSQRARETVVLDVEVKAIHDESRGRYGSPRVHRELLRQGRGVSRKRVAKRMKVLGLYARRPKRYRRTTESDSAHSPAPNLLGRRFVWPKPCQAWAGDITYLWTCEGWVYLAIIIDLCTRKIVGWSASRSCDTVLALRALEAAIARHRPATGLMHHTDRGSTYTASSYQRRLRELGMKVSMSRRGNCWDNAVAESVIGTIKVELFGEHVPKDLKEVEQALFQYIEGFFNRRRLHSSLGYITPDEKEAVVSKPKVA